MDLFSKRLAILLILVLFTGSMTLTFFSDGADASSLSIIDYDHEGIAADSTQYFALLIHSSQPVDLTVNVSVLEFVGSSGWPQLEMRIFEFQDYNYTEGYLSNMLEFE
jgi:hypothetical protein